jgi:hypothetical protein
MKWWLLSFLASGVVLGAEAPRWNLRADFHIIRVSPERAMVLIPRLNRDDSASAAFAELQADCLQGRAERVTWLSLGSLPRVEAWATSAEKVRYPAEFFQDPGPVDPSAPAEPNALLYPVRRCYSRDGGASLQLTPTLFDGVNVGFSFATRYDPIDGRDRFESGVQADGSKWAYEYPVFLHRLTESHVLVRNGVPLLVGSFKLPMGGLELHVIKVRARGQADVETPVLPALPPRLVRVEEWRFRLPLADAMIQRAAWIDGAHPERNLAELLKWAGEGRAELIDWKTVPIRDRDTGATANERERAAGEEPHTHHPADVSGSVSDFLIRMGIDRANLFDPPLTYEARHFGGRLGADAWTTADEKSIRMQVRSRHTSHHGFSRWSSGPNFQGRTSHAFQPDVRMRQASYSLALPNGRPVLLAFYKLDEPGDRVEIAILRATASTLMVPAI